MRQLSGFDLIHLHYPLIFGGELTALARGGIASRC